MITCTIHEPPDPPADSLDRAEALTFVRDGFSFVATILAPLWLLSAQLWEAVGAYLAAVALLLLLAWGFGLDLRWVALLIGALHLWIGFEGSSLERWTLERRGWRMLATVGGRDVAECEQRFFDAWLPDQPMIDAGRLGPAAAAFASVGDDAIASTAGPRSWREFRPLSWSSR